jgi:hypothetical protein
MLGPLTLLSLCHAMALEVGVRKQIVQNEKYLFFQCAALFFMEFIS